MATMKNINTHFHPKVTNNISYLQNIYFFKKYLYSECIQLRKYIYIYNLKLKLRKIFRFRHWVTHRYGCAARENQPFKQLT